MKALIEFLHLKLLQTVNKIVDLWHIFLDFIEWPVWYFAGMTILLFILSVEILGTWSAWAYLMLGFIVFGFKRMK